MDLIQGIFCLKFSYFYFIFTAQYLRHFMYSNNAITYIPNANFIISLWEVCLLRCVHPADLEA